MITVALAKGRLAQKAYELFKKVGIDVDLDFDSRKLIFQDDKKEYSFLLVKPSDVCTYVELGTADIGIVGEDCIMEEDKDIYKVLKLGFGKCSVCIAGKVGTAVTPYMKVATKYPNISKAYFNEIGVPVNLIKLHGSVELAPVTGLSDVIVDIVETGGTLKENGLEVIETINSCSASLIVNKSSMKIKKASIVNIINSLKEQVENEDNKIQ